MDRPTFTIDRSFFATSQIKALEDLLELYRSGRIELFTSTCPYSCDHQSDEYVDVSHLLEGTHQLPETGHDISEEISHVKTGRMREDGSFHRTRFSESTLERFKKFSRQLYGKYDITLKSYEEYRLHALSEHMNADIDWFVTCDHDRLLGPHGKSVLTLWSVKACDPQRAVSLAESTPLR